MYLCLEASGGADVDTQVTEPSVNKIPDDFNPGLYM